MRTAKEIMTEAFIQLMIAEDNRLTTEEARNEVLEQYEDDKEIAEIFISIINISRKEVIEESAAICHEHMDSDCFDGEGAEANILNLINELK